MLCYAHGRAAHHALGHRVGLAKVDPLRDTATGVTPGAQPEVWQGGRVLACTTDARSPFRPVVPYLRVRGWLL
jgi:hypothetical protein